MSSLPGAIIFVNNNLNNTLTSTLVKQLQITDTINDIEFNNRIVADPNYPAIIHSNNLRVLVILQTFQDYTNRTLADLVIFVSQGLAYIEKNNFGPPALALPVYKLNIYDLLRFNNSPNVVILPPSVTQPLAKPLGGIFAIEGIDQSGVHSVNPDNEYNNPDFINRK